MRFLIIFLLPVLTSEIANAQIIIEEEPRALYYERTHERVRKLWKMKDFRDVFHKNKFLLGRNRIMGNISYNTGRVLIDDGKEVHPEIRQATAYYARIRFLEEFSINTTFYKDYNRKASARWIADFNYSIGRYNWRPDKINFGYENFINNKYSDSPEILLRNLMEGYFFVSYNQSPDKATKFLLVDSTSGIRIKYFARYSFKYRDENEISYGGIFAGKPTLGMAMRYTIFWNIYAESALYFYYPFKKQQPWDPDYTYGFGYFDWRSFRLSITYGNWAINRFSWNKSGYENYGFLDGNFRIVANWIW